MMDSTDTKTADGDSDSQTNDDAWAIYRAAADVDPTELDTEHPETYCPRCDDETCQAHTVDERHVRVSCTDCNYSYIRQSVKASDIETSNGPNRELTEFAD